MSPSQWPQVDAVVATVTVLDADVAAPAVVVSGAAAVRAYNENHVSEIQTWERESVMVWATYESTLLYQKQRVMLQTGDCHPNLAIKQSTHS